MSKNIIIGITGGFGTGKTTVARMFKRLGAAVIDADKIAHDVILPGGDLYRKIISAFGTPILKKNGRIDRKRLGKRVFNDRKSCALLNSLIHPEVIKKIRYVIKKRGRLRNVLIIDAPLLVEAGLDDEMDRLIVVTADRKTQIKRCRKKFGLKKEEILKRIRSQMALSKKRRLADFIIDNSGSFDSTRKTVKKIWREIKDGTGIKD